MKIVIEKEEGKDINISINGNVIEVIEALSYSIGAFLTSAFKEGFADWGNVGTVIEHLVKPRIKDGFFDNINRIKREEE